MAEDVEEEPGGEEGREEEERQRIRQERYRQHGGHDHEVVGAEIAVVFAEALVCLAERFWLREARPISELRPMTALREAGVDRLGDAGK